jgi:hypothetical protein
MAQSVQWLAASWTAKETRFIFPLEQEIFLFSKASRLALWVTNVLFTRHKGIFPGCKACGSRN